MGIYAGMYSLLLSMSVCVCVTWYNMVVGIDTVYYMSTETTNHAHDHVLPRIVVGGGCILIVLSL